MKANKTDFFLVLLLVLFSTRANDVYQNIFVGSLLTIGTIFILRKRKIKINDDLLKILIVYFVIIIAQTIIEGSYHPLFILRYLYFITFAYLVVIIVNSKFFPILINVVYKLTLISLPLYTINIFFHDTLFQFIKTLQSLTGITTALDNYTEYANILVYTLRSVDELYRNAGFMWEPGAFASVLVIVIALHLAINKFKLDHVFFVLFIGVITTLSTTGFIALGIVAIFYLYNKKLVISLSLLPLLIIIGIYVAQLDFMYEKIEELSANPQEKLSMNLFMTGNQTFLSLGRFAGLLFNLELFLKYPFFGIGGNDELLFNKNNIYLFSTNGLGTYLMTFGAAGFFLLFYNLSKTFSYFTRAVNNTGSFILVILIITTSFSFMVLMTPLFFAFQFYYMIEYPRAINNVG